MEKKEKKLTDKQERFCREYVLCMDKSKAYRLAYDTSKMKEATVNNEAYKLFKRHEIAARIQELKKDIEEALGISKITVINDLLRVRDQSLEPVPVMEWKEVVKEFEGKDGKTYKRKVKELVQKEDENGNLVWMFDSAGANGALDKIMKAMGYYEAEKKDITSGGKPLMKTIVIDD